MAKWYGSLSNRIEEGHNFSNKPLEVGTDITMYYWSDRTCYYITRVVDQKHIFVKQYDVVADRSKEGGMGHQNWVYFKTRKECNAYLRSFGLDAEENPTETCEQEWCFRYGHWNLVIRYNLEGYNKALELARGDCSHPEDEDCVRRVAQYYFRVSDEDLEKILAGKEVVKYTRIPNGISFGVRDYYYDWSF